MHRRDLLDDLYEMRDSFIVHPIALITGTVAPHAHGRTMLRRDRKNSQRLTEHASVLLALGNLEPERTTERETLQLSRPQELAP